MHCGAPLGERDGEGVKGTSHSICRECWYEYWVFKNPECKAGIYPDDRELMEKAAGAALELREEWERLALAPVIVWQGIRAEMVKARKSYGCRECGGIIDGGKLYYQVTYGSGLGAMKFPDRVHTQCLEQCLEAHRK
jgi:hypothetical protein